MTQSAFFLRARAISFSCIMFLGLLWIIIHSLCLFAQWDVMDHFERSLIFIMLLVNTATLIMLPILLINEFRPWLDATRCLFLILCHFGMAIFFAVKKSSFQCIYSNPDQDAVCDLIILYISVTSWFIPVLVVGYSCGLAYLVYRVSQTQDTTPNDVEKQQVDASKSDEGESTPKLDTYHYAI
ncbi:hypothetical protein JR316_0003687 [Psilocybe cubensis]|uniref:Uncharacterized protein n=1 Tax=Psilocybe cubensis TaxID=181762 RepID=A0ACB8H972_PSICU|nr:hypothetical protein JR316_0003687 [Psilocybe cubensis]KAH9484207.1 hypothetical protein JR316_0003687 [Psilocybe cubensis]